MNINKIEVTHKDAVRSITLNRPDLRNAFDEQMIESITAAFKAAAAEEEVRVIVLAAAG